MSTGLRKRAPEPHPDNNDACCETWLPSEFGQARHVGRRQMVQELRLVPALDTDVRRINAGLYALRRIIPLEDLLSHIDRDLKLEGGLPEAERRETALAYDELLDEAVTDVVVPTHQSINPEETIFGPNCDLVERQGSRISSRGHAASAKP